MMERLGIRMRYGLTEHRQRWVRLVLIAFALTFPFFIARSQLIDGDPAYYVGLAQSLASGHGYTFIGRNQTTYPPGLPFLLTPFVAFAGPNLVLIQLVIAGFAAISLAAVLSFLRAYDIRAESIVGFLLALSFPFFAFATQNIRTELSYLATSAFALRLVWSPPEKISASWARVILGALTAATVMFRTIGMALPIAFLVAWAHRRIRRYPRAWTDRALLAGGGGGLLAAFLWFAWTMPQRSGSYVGLLLMMDPHEPDLGRTTILSMLARIPGALAVQLTHLAEVATGIPWMLVTWLSPVTIALAISLGVGLYHELRSPNPVLGWYAMGYGAILLLWPFDEGVRFIFPIFPFLILLIWQGWVRLAGWAAGNLRGGSTRAAGSPESSGWVRLGWLGVAALALGFFAVILLRRGDLLSSRQGWAIASSWLVIGAFAFYRWGSRLSVHLGSWMRRAPILLLTLYAVLNLTRTVPSAVSQLQGRETGAVGMHPAIEWLRRHAAPDDVVMTQSISGVYFYTGLKTVRLPLTRDRHLLLTTLRESRPTYLLIKDTPEFVYYRPTEVERFAILQREAGSELFDLAYRFPTGTIYRVR
jgi:hypothetical protein